MIPLFALFFALVLPEPAPPLPTIQPVWAYHSKALHRSIETSDFYAAKQALVHLQRLDPQTYAQKRYDLTAAWIAGKEQNWATAYALNLQGGFDDDTTALEAAQSLEKMGRFAQAIDTAFAKGIKYRGNARWEALALSARCRMALGLRKEAMADYRKLTASGVPTVHRTDAYNMLVELYYKDEEPRKARRLAESVQEHFPGSDAALFTMYLQERFETPAYLNDDQNLERFADVSYRNRDFERSNRFFGRLAGTGRKDHRALRAHYFLALTYTKQGDPAGAKAAFLRAAPLLRGSAFAGPAAFQLARTHYLNGEDAATIDLVQDYWAHGDDPKWRTESVRLWILALRRENNLAEFQDLGRTLNRTRGFPRGILQYYHQNGMIWAAQESRFEEAAQHLDAYLSLGGLSKDERVEAKVWQGLIDWSLGREETAIAAWIDAAWKDPNHYFGLAARRLLAEAVPQTHAWEQASASADLNDLNTLRRLYLLAPDAVRRDQIGSRLTAAFTRENGAFSFNEPTGDPDAAELAEIGRFDRAAQTLTKNKRQYQTYHFHKARWYQLAGDMKASISHAEILLNSFPDWMPYELLPLPVQQLSFPLGYGELVRQRAASQGVDPYLLLAIIREESRFDHNAKSWASARGLMQFIPSTARTMAAQTPDLGTFSLPRLYQPEVAVALGATYVAHLTQHFDGSGMHAVAAYNAGENATARWRDFSKGSRDLAFVWDVSYSETKRYCQKVMRAYHHYCRLYGNPNDVISVPQLGAAI